MGYLSQVRGTVVEVMPLEEGAVPTGRAVDDADENG
jgi:hypothetical protein